MRFLHMPGSRSSWKAEGWRMFSTVQQCVVWAPVEAGASQSGSRVEPQPGSHESGQGAVRKDARNWILSASLLQLEISELVSVLFVLPCSQALSSSRRKTEEYSCFLHLRLYSADTTHFEHLAEHLLLVGHEAVRRSRPAPGDQWRATLEEVAKAGKRAFLYSTPSAQHCTPLAPFT